MKIKLDERLKFTFCTTLLIGLAAHFFALNNVIQNHDNISNQPEGLGAGVISGRWLLSFLENTIHKLCGTWNIPFFNGLLLLIFLSITVCIMVDLFDIRSKALCGIWGGLFISFPTVTCILFFMFAAPYYAFAVFLAVTAVWVMEKIPKGGYGLGIFLCACSLGIYQAYFPMTVSILLLLLIQKSLKHHMNLRKFLYKGIIYIIWLVLSLGVYGVLLKIFLKVYQMSLTDYKGINNMGKINWLEFPQLLKETYENILNLPFNNYLCLVPTPMLKLSIIIVTVLTFGGLLTIVFNRKNWVTGIEVFVGCLLLPLALNCIVIMVPDGNIYTNMAYAIVFVYLFPLMVLDIFNDSGCIGFPDWIKYVKIGLCLIASFVILNYIWLSNGNYTQIYYKTVQGSNYFTSLVTEVKMTDGYDPSFQWAFIGKSFEDETFSNPWESFSEYSYGGNYYDAINYYSRISFIRTYTGYNVEVVEDGILNDLRNNPVVQDMPCYPYNGSIKIVDNIIVVKISDEEE